ncbi:GAF and ANTAR domain-containing protein [Jatrophihabitans sp.]|uniref:GAF and ANTAR domain-containing protein n=1 Tax=Jatrophihabitans sp. TaxID=1932789 RepID=UPI002B980A38|nr:GAF and ANTAR domain-containing protein [Jatrophihabitans sp.]
MRTDDVWQAADIVAGMADEFTELARSISGNSSLEPAQLLHRLLSVAAATVPGSEHASITLITGNGRPHTSAASDDLPAQVDRIQYQTGEGPCLQAAATSDVVLADDLTNAPEWPAFAGRAVIEAGVRSMLCYRLFLTEDNRGALNFYALQPGAFDESSVAIGAIFAAYTSMVQLAALHHDKAVHLSRALESNREIGIAMGILMANEHLTQNEAFTQLRGASQDLHRKLREIAADVIYTGTLPEHRPAPGPASPN